MPRRGYLAVRDGERTLVITPLGDRTLPRFIMAARIFFGSAFATIIAVAFTAREHMSMSGWFFLAALSCVIFIAPLPQAFQSAWRRRLDKVTILEVGRRDLGGDAWDYLSTRYDDEAVALVRDALAGDERARQTIAT